MDRYNVETADRYDMEPAPDGMWVMHDDAQAAIAAAVAAERERCARAVVDYSLSYPFDENDRSLFDECAQYVRDGVLPRA